MTVEQNLLLRGKLVLVGNSGVGKSTILQGWHSDGQAFPKTYAMTIHQEVHIVGNLAEPNVSVELFCHDISGSELFSESWSKYIDGASCFILVYDCTNQDSFEHLSRWLSLCRRARKTIQGILASSSASFQIANKTDLTNRRVISSSVGQEFAKSQNMSVSGKVSSQYFECSATSLSHVEPFFLYAANSIYAKYASAVGKLKEL